jgi:hypothetical protein
MKTVLAMIILGVELCGCAASPRTAARKEAEENRPVCTSRAQCDAMWAAARAWAGSAWCGHRIRVATDSYIETYESEGNETSLACWVRLESRPAGGYELVAHARCANWFLCSPPAADAVVAFNTKVTSAGSMPAP